MGTNDAQLADILARLAAAERELAARRDHRPRRRIRAGRLATVTLALLLALTPLSLLAANFVDLNPGSPHNADINAIADAGISKGCSDSAHYCPNDFVTREQMASFLARTAGLGGNPPVANAARLALTSPTPGGPTFAANDLARVARTVVPNSVLPNPSPSPITVTAELPQYQMIGTVAITAPAAGFVVVSAQSLGVTTNGALFMRLRDATSGEVSPLIGQGIGVAGPGVTAFTLNATLATIHVFPVAAGPRTFVLEAASAGATDGDLYDTEIIALFIPFGYNGGTSLAP